MTDKLHEAIVKAALERAAQMHWEDADEGFCTKWKAAALGGHYELVWFEDKQGFSVNFSWGRPLSFWFIQGEPDEYGPTGPKSFTTLDQAKAAAQADYAGRILSALEPTTPSPEAIVRAALERAARVADKKIFHFTGHWASALLEGEFRKIRSLADDPAEVAAIIKKAGERHD
jgi:hypothetical protein